MYTLFIQQCIALGSGFTVLLKEIPVIPGQQFMRHITQEHLLVCVSVNQDVAHLPAFATSRQQAHIHQLIQHLAAKAQISFRGMEQPCLTLDKQGLEQSTEFPHHTVVKVLEQGNICPFTKRSKGQYPDDLQSKPGLLTQLIHATLYDPVQAHGPIFPILGLLHQQLYLQPTQVVRRRLSGAVQVMPGQTQGHGPATQQLGNLLYGLLLPALPGPGPQHILGLLIRQGLQVQAQRPTIAFLPGGDQYPALPAQAQHSREVARLLSPVQNQQYLFAPQSRSHLLLRVGLSLDAQGQGNSLNGLGSLGLMVKAVKDDAVREAVNREPAHGTGCQ